MAEQEPIKPEPVSQPATPKPKQAPAPKPSGSQQLLESLKGLGIGSVLVRKSGGLVYSTVQIEDVVANTLASLGKVTETLLKRTGDEQKELEITADNDLIVIIPVKSHFLCGILKSRDQKKTLREYAAKLKAVI